MKKILILILGMYSLSTYAQDSITAIEWWINKDYSTHQYQVIPPSNTINGVLNVDLSSVPVGNHLVHLRFKDNKGQWSPMFTRNISKPPAGDSGIFIAGCEYWINNNFSASELFLLDDPISMVDTTMKLDMSAFPDGNHVLSFRFFDNTGKSSPIFRRYIRKYPPGNAVNLITGYRYWFNDSLETMQQVVLDESEEILESTISIPVEGFKPGDTVLIHLQFRDLLGDWSGVIADTFEIFDNTSIENFAGNTPNMMIYPNPATKEVIVEFLPVSYKVSILQMMLFDSSGKMVLQRRIENHQNASIRLNVENLPVGVYYLWADDGQQNYRKKIIKE